MHLERPLFARRLVAGATLCACALAAPSVAASLPIESDVTLEVTLPELPDPPWWLLDLTRLAPISTVQSVLDGVTYEVCSTPAANVAETCSLPVPLGVPVLVDVDRHRLPGLFGLLGPLSVDFTARLSLALGDADGSSDVLGLGDWDLGDTFDGVALRFDLTRGPLDGLDGRTRPGGRVYARLHVPIAGYDALLGFEAFERLSDGSSVALSLRGEDLIPATEGRFATEYLLAHSSPAASHAVLIGLARVERDGVFGPRLAHDPLSVSLRFTTAPTAMAGTLVAEQTPSFEGLAVTYTLPAGQRPGLELLAGQRFTSADRMQPSVATRQLRATLDRLPGNGRLAIAHTAPEGRDRVDAELDTSEVVPRVTVSELLTFADGGTDHLELALHDVRPLDCGVSAPCATVTALLPRRLADGVFDPVVSGDLGVPPVGTRFDVALTTERGGPPSRIRASAVELPRVFALDADLDLAARVGHVDWRADGAATDLALALLTPGLSADLRVVDVPSEVRLAVDADRVDVATNGTIGRIDGWLTTTDRAPIAGVDGQHLIGDVTLAGGPAEVALALDVRGLDDLRVRTDRCPDGSAARGCVELETPGTATLPIALDLDVTLGGETLAAQGVLTRLPATTFLALRQGAIDLEVDGTVGAHLVASLGGAPLPSGPWWSWSDRIVADVGPTTVSAAVALARLPARLHVDLDAVRGFRALHDPDALFAVSDGEIPIPSLLDDAPLAELEGVTGNGELLLDVTLSESDGAADVTIDGTLTLDQDVSELVVGPIGVQSHEVFTRAIEAHVAYVGGTIEDADLTLTIAKADGYRDVVHVGLDALPHELAFLSAVGNASIEVPGEDINGQGVAVLLTHSGELRPEVTVQFLDEALAAELTGDDAWHVDAVLADVPDSVWVVAGGSHPGSDDGLGCLGIAIPSPTLEYRASEPDLGLDLVLAGGLLSGLVDGTRVHATIRELPRRASIGALDGAEIIKIIAYDNDIQDIRIDIDARIRLRVDCSFDAEVGPFAFGAGIVLEGADSPTATIGVGRVSIVLGQVESFELDFSDLGALLKTDLTLSGFPLRINLDHVDASLRLGVDAEACFEETVFGVTAGACADFDASVSLAAGLRTYYFDRGRERAYASFDIRDPTPLSDAGCSFEGGLELDRVGEDDADFGLLLPELDSDLLVGIATLFDVLQGRDLDDVFYLDADCSF